MRPGYCSDVPTTNPATLRDRFGIIVNVFTFGMPSDRLFAHLVEIAAAIEATSFDTLWLPDHMVQGPVGDIGDDRSPHTPIPDALTLLAALAVTTDACASVRSSARSPSATRQRWRRASPRPTSCRASARCSASAPHGMPTSTAATASSSRGRVERVSRLADAVPICRAMFDEEAATYSGAHFSVDEAYNVPRPMSRIPILVGGAGKRTLRIAARHADACNPIGTTDELRDAFELFDRHCDEVGRDRSEVAKQAGIMFHRVEALYPQVEAAFGLSADGVILVPWQLALGPDDVHEIGERLAREFS